MWWLLFAVLTALGGDCKLDVPPDTPFVMPPPKDTEHVRVLVELWIEEETDRAWASEVLPALESREAKALLVLPLPDSEPSAAHVGWLADRVAAGHEVAVVLSTDEVPRDALANTKSHRQRLRWFRRAGIPVKVVASPIPGRVSEALLGKLGFKTILLLRGPATAQPRMAAVFEGQPRINVVLQGGPYAGECGTSPRTAGFTPASADRVTRAIDGAARFRGAPTVRVALHPGEDPSADAAVLGRWLDEVAIPSGVLFESVNRARLAALQAMRTGSSGPVEDDPGGGRLVRLEELETAAAALADVNVLPRELPGDLNLTEAFYGFLVLLAGREEGTVVRLGALSGPTDATENRVTGVVDVDEAALRTLAARLLDDLPSEIPAAMPVGDTLLDAAEILTAMASVVRGDDPPRTWPTASPDPSSRGLGWGEATLP